MEKNPWLEIFDYIGLAAAFCQLAEEAAELSAIASKLDRIVRGENPSRMNEAEAYEKLLEEVADVHNALNVLDIGMLDKGYGNLLLDAESLQPVKMTRWYNSILAEVDTN